jgi:hypothetical protein
MMNKLSPGNRSRLLNGLKDHVNADFGLTYIKVTWELLKLQPSNQKLYIEVCEILREVFGSANNEQMWQTVFNDYVENRYWIGVHGAVPPSPNEYDRYCEYVKWKKCAMAAASGLCHLISASVIELNVRTLVEHILSGEANVADRSDQLMALVETRIPLGESKQMIKSYCKTVHTGDLDSLTQFKLVELEKKLSKAC